MSVSDYALITLAEARVFPGLSGPPSSEDSVLESLIDAATFDFEAYWDNYGVQREVTERVSWSAIKRGSRNHDIIWLQKYPIASVTSITDPDSNTVDSDEYWIDYDLGALRTTGGWTIPQDSNGFATYWTVVYTAGRVATTALVPANIKAACKAWVYQLYKRPDRDLISKSVGALSLAYSDRKETSDSLPPDIQARIALWKKRDI